MAIIKQNVCTGERVYWYKANYFPSEPTFVGSPDSDSTQEDDGVLLFSVMHGATQDTFLMVINATTMEPISQTSVPTTMTFTTHGQFYRDLVSHQG